MVKPLVFGTPAQPAQAKEKGPKALSFPPASAPIVENKRNETLAAAPVPNLPAGDLSIPKKLILAPATQPVTQSAPKAVFQQQLSPIAKSAVAELKRSYADLYAKEGPHLERQINQLLPLETLKIMQWAGSSLTSMTEVASECSTLIREFTEKKGSDIIAETVNVLSGKRSFMQKLMREDNVSTRPQLVVLKTWLELYVPKCEELLPKAELAAQKLVNKLTTLRVIGEVAGRLPDATLSDALQERQMLLTQASTQAALLTQQLQDTRRVMVDQLSRVNQLILVTIPAFEAAKSSR